MTRESLSARRAWIEIPLRNLKNKAKEVALRKESVDRNEPEKTITPKAYKSLSARRAWIEMLAAFRVPVPPPVALRKESVDRNVHLADSVLGQPVALRKESVDRNNLLLSMEDEDEASLSARRAWIEMRCFSTRSPTAQVALRKESVDRNLTVWRVMASCAGRSPQGERG